MSREPGSNVNNTRLVLSGGLLAAVGALFIFVILPVSLDFSPFKTIQVKAQSCNNACGSTGSCNAGFSCNGGVCKNPSCPGVTGCVCPPSTQLDGTFQFQDGQNICSTPLGTPPPNLRLNLTNGASAVCSTTTTTYHCTISYTNIPTTQATLVSDLAGYLGAWKNPASPGTCSDPNSTTQTIDSGTTLTWPVYYIITPWMKTQNTSFHTNGLSSSFVIPPSTTPLSGASYTGLADSGNGLLIDSSVGNNAGLAGSEGSSFPANIEGPPQKISTNNWQSGSNGAYTFPIGITESGYLAYVQSRKQYQTLSTFPSDLSSLASGIYYYPGNATITNGPSKNVVMIVDGTVLISADLKQASSLAIIAGGTISVANSVYQVNAILVGGGFNAGTSSTGLFVNGNIISVASIINNRNLPDNRMPSVYVQFNPQTYLNLLPFLSTDTYDWKQLQ